MTEYKFTYKLADLLIASDINLSYAYRVENDNYADIIIEELREPKIEVFELQKKHKNGSFMIYRYGAGEAVFSYDRQGYFNVSDGKCIRYYLYEGYNYEFVIQTILCQCMGALFAQRKMIGIHSGVCYMHGKSIIICGESGAGKSSTVSELLRRGAEFMADDTAYVSVNDESISVHALVPLRKLCMDTLNVYAGRDDKLVRLPDEDKVKMGIKEDEAFHIKCEDVGILCWLRADEVTRVSVRELQGVEKLTVLNKNLYAPGAYKHIWTDKTFFEKFNIFCNKIPMYEIVRPKMGMTIQETANAIEELIR